MRKQSNGVAIPRNWVLRRNIYAAGVIIDGIEGPVSSSAISIILCSNHIRLSKNFCLRLVLMRYHWLIFFFYFCSCFGKSVWWNSLTIPTSVSIRFYFTYSSLAYDSSVAYMKHFLKIYSNTRSRIPNRFMTDVNLTFN